MFRKPRALDPVECRVLGALLEKEQSTPEYYPMTLSALVAAANQKTNREPVMELTEDEVGNALERLFKDVLVWRSPGSRATRWSHNLDRRWGLTPATKAAVTLLLLRGEQTAGEIRGRSERLHPFASIAEAEAALRDLAAGEEPLSRELPRFPGQKENRWRHLAGVAANHTGADAGASTEMETEAALAFALPPSAPARPAPARIAAEHPVESGLATRVERLERRLARIESELGLEPEGES